MGKAGPGVGLVWFRGADLRVRDNLLLQKAARSGRPVLPVFCLPSPEERPAPYHGQPRMGPHRARFLIESLEDLRKGLRGLGSDLLIAKGTAMEVLPRLLAGRGNCSVYVQDEPFSEEQGEVEAVRRSLDAADGCNADVEVVWQRTLFHPDDLPAPCAPGRMPNQFTEWRQCLEKSPAHPSPDGGLPAQGSLPLWKPEGGEADGFEFLPQTQELTGQAEGPADPPTHPSNCMHDTKAGRFVGGESAGLERIREWMWAGDGPRSYFDTRNGLLGSAYSTKFSPWMAVGALSPRTIYTELKSYESKRVKNKSTYWVLFELLWRDFFSFQAAKQGNRLFFEWGPSGMPSRHHWTGGEEEFRKWREGKTGQPFIDANMRELALTGWMSNRGRQNVASYLIFDLKVDWRLGAEYFEGQLLDYDTASNWGNWAAAANLFGGRQNRFNPQKQAGDYDPEGKYIRTWIPDAKTVTYSGSSRRKIGGNGRYGDLRNYFKEVAGSEEKGRSRDGAAPPKSAGAGADGADEAGRPSPEQDRTRKRKRQGRVQHTLAR